MVSATQRGAGRNKKSRGFPIAGVVYVTSTFNNNVITITDVQGNTLAWTSSGKYFKGSRKSTAYAAQVATSTAAKKVFDGGMRSVSVTVRGPGLGRESAVRAIQAVGLNVLSIKYEVFMPHNGCRPKKRRRL